MLDRPMQGRLFSIAERQPVDGFYPPERDHDGVFCWTRPRFALHRPRGSRYLALCLGRPDSTGQLTVTDDRPIATRVNLAAGWHWYSLDLGSKSRETVELTVDSPLDSSDGVASLGMMIRSIAWHNSSPRHARIERARANAIVNEQEYKSGAVAMRSVPPYLRLTMEIRCNIANDKPCVYCAWKWMKNQEIGSPPSNVSFIRALEPYLSLAKVVNDSSYGEPPLHPEFAEIINLICTDERAFSFVSNGKTLRRKVRRALLGRNVYLYVSIDSASSAGYARYRDNSFDRIIADLRTLCREKKSHRNLPHITTSFIVMHSNKHELSDFIALMSSVGVDRVKLMSLSRDNPMELDGPVQRRGTFVFNYDEEVIPLAELEVIGNETRGIAAELGVDLYIDWNDFETHHGPEGNQPLCSEPWKSLYVLNRGIFPCCFGRKPLAHWAEQGDRSISQFIDETFNGDAFQEIRRSLASGIFPSYCLSTKGCPIVRHATADGAASPFNGRMPKSTSLG
jgi:MoaA/NifB/PqqE/SkfB family radical SAM enzyme